MNKKISLAVIIVVIIVAAGVLWFNRGRLAHKNTAQQSQSPKAAGDPEVDPKVVVSALPQGFPLGNPSQLLASYQGKQNGLMESIYQYSSTSTPTNVGATYQSYFSSNNWALVAPVNTTTTELLQGKKNNNTILVTINQSTSGSGSTVTVKLQQP